MPNLSRELLDFRDETVACSLDPDPEPLPNHSRRTPRYNAGMALAAYAAGTKAAQDAQAQAPKMLEGDALVAWWDGRVAGRP